MLRKEGRAWAFVALAVSLAFTANAKADWVNGWWVYPYSHFATNLCNWRPLAANQKGLSVSDWYIHDVPINQKGMMIGASGVTPYLSWAYRWAAVWHCEIKGVWRSGPGAHTDFIRVYGQRNQDVPTTLLFQDIYLHDGDGIPMLIQDGTFDKITLKDVRYARTTVGLQISTLNCGSVGTIVIDHCPYTSLTLYGRPGTIGTVYVKNSPGFKLVDAWTAYGQSKAKVVYLN